MPNPDPPAIHLAGPTAVGKSALAIELARRLGGEIISVDSVQVYRGLDIGSAKPTAYERAQVPHHLLDVIELSQSFDAAQFVRLARAAENEIRGRGRVPIYCGGTGFYFKALLHGLSTAPPSDPVTRAELEATPVPELLAELAVRDPVAFQNIDRQNPRRVIRALEIIRLTNRPFADFQALPPPANAPVLHVLSLPPALLNARINRRVDRMIQIGLVEETRALLQQGLRENETARQALGYRQITQHLDAEIALSEAVKLIKLRTRQFAKRQITFFKHQFEAHWLECDGDNNWKTIVNLTKQSGIVLNENRNY